MGGVVPSCYYLKNKQPKLIESNESGTLVVDSRSKKFLEVKVKNPNTIIEYKKYMNGLYLFDLLVLIYFFWGGFSQVGISLQRRKFGVWYNPKSWRRCRGFGTIEESKQPHLERTWKK